MVEEKELVREEEFWDKVGRKWLDQKEDTDLRVISPYQFLSGSSVAFDFLLSQLGELNGARILDYGCGSGWLSTYLAQRGARVDGFDISGELVALGLKRARVNGVSERVHLTKMIAERLDFPDNTFDAVVGISILHHISIEEGAKELYRVLKPGGKGFFIEPLGESGFVNWIRNYVLRIHHGFVRAVDAEHPLTYSNINSIGSRFSSTFCKEFQLLEMIARITGDRLTKWLGVRWLDKVLLTVFPSLRRFCRLVVITYSK